jgi:FkbM family methyltransferase
MILFRTVKRWVKTLVLSTRFSRLLLSYLNRLLRSHNVVTKYSDYIAEEPLSHLMHNGNTMYLYPSDHKAQMYFSGSAFDDAVYQLWCKRAPLFRYVFDIGANYGQFTLAPVTRTDRGLVEAIFTFEPNPKLAKALALSIAQSELDDVVVLVEKGVSNEPGAASFTLNLHSSGGSSLDEDVAVNPLTGRYVHKIDIALTDLASAEELQSYDFSAASIAMKIDVEGHDFYALEGAASILHEASDLFVVIEADYQSYRHYFHSSNRPPAGSVVDLFVKNQVYCVCSSVFEEVRSLSELGALLKGKKGCVDLIFSSSSLPVDTDMNNVSGKRIEQ